MAKKMSSKHIPVCSGKMSSQHGLTKNTSPTKGMSNAEGRVGASTRPFHNTLAKEAGKK